MKSLLYIDPISSKGHLNFNIIYIKSLYSIFDSIDFAFKDGYEKKLSLEKNAKKYLIPKKYYKTSQNNIFNRYNLLRIFNYIKKECNLNQYDFVLFSSYEEVSLYFSFIKRPVILVNHNNLRNLHNPIKLFFFKKVANRNINIVFEQYMKDYLEKLEIENIHVVHHGLPNPLNRGILNNTELEKEFDFLKKYRHVIFSPSGSSMDKEFLKNLISNKLFHSFLEKENMLFIVKGKFENPISKNIQIIDKYLTDSQYQYLFLKSNIILVSYPSTHEYRVSAILFECMANNKFCLLSEIEALTTYSKYFNYNPYFNSSNELIKKLRQIIEFPEDFNKPYEKLKELNPELKKIFDTKMCKVFL